MNLKLYTTNEAAVLMGVSKARVDQKRHQLARRGIIVGKLLGHNWVYTNEDIARMRVHLPTGHIGGGTTP